MLNQAKNGVNTVTESSSSISEQSQTLAVSSSISDDIDTAAIPNPSSKNSVRDPTQPLEINQSSINESTISKTTSSPKEIGPGDPSENDSALLISSNDEKRVSYVQPCDDELIANNPAGDNDDNNLITDGPPAHIELNNNEQQPSNQQVVSVPDQMSKDDIPGTGMEDIKGIGVSSGQVTSNTDLPEEDRNSHDDRPSVATGLHDVLKSELDNGDVITEEGVKPHQQFKDEKEASEKIIKYDPEMIVGKDHRSPSGRRLSGQKLASGKQVSVESSQQSPLKGTTTSHETTTAAVTAASWETKKRTREQNVSSPKVAHQKDALSSRSTAAPNEDTDLSDDELNESSSNSRKNKSPSRKLKKRRTNSSRGSLSSSKSRSSVAADNSIDNIHLTLQSLPRGWRDPLCYFAMLKAYVDEKGLTKKAWMRLPLRRVSNGAAWLTESCSGTPGVPDHVDGPTEIVRDLCSCMQGSEDEFKLHPRSHVSITRGTIRKDFDDSKLDVQHPFTIPRLVKIQTEKEYVHFLPLDLVASQICQQIRSIVTTSGLFPSHIFAPDIHICQNAPTIALHMALYQKSKTLDSLLSTFLNDESQKQFDKFRDFYNKHLASKTISNRRRRGAELGDVFTGTVELSQSDIQDFTNLCDLIDKQLDTLRSNIFVTSRPISNGLSQKNYSTDDVIIADLPATILTRYSAALRDHVYQYYDIPPHILAYDLDEDDPLYDCLIKESCVWLDSPLGVYIDITLSPQEEDYLISSSRWSGTLLRNTKSEKVSRSNSSRNSSPSSSSSTNDPIENIQNRALLHHIISHTGTNSNTKLVVTLPSTEMRNDVLVKHRCHISLVATKDIPSNSSIVLDDAWKKVTWAEIAADNETK